MHCLVQAAMAKHAALLKALDQILGRAKSAHMPPTYSELSEHGFDPTLITGHGFYAVLP